MITNDLTFDIAPDLPTVFGQAFTYEVAVAPVTPGSGTPTGDVTFTFLKPASGPSPITISLSTDCLSTCHPFATLPPLSNLPAGPVDIKMDYSGDDNFVKTSSTFITSVQKASTKTTISSDENPSIVGQQTTVNATVTPVAPGAGTPTGKVTFTIDNIAQTPISLTNGTATLILPMTLKVGNHQIIAHYLGDSNFVLGTSSTLAQKVEPNLIGTWVGTEKDVVTNSNGVICTGTRVLTLVLTQSGIDLTGNFIGGGETLSGNIDCGFAPPYFAPTSGTVTGSGSATLGIPGVAGVVIKTTFIDNTMNGSIVQPIPIVSSFNLKR